MSKKYWVLSKIEKQKIPLPGFYPMYAPDILSVQEVLTNLFYYCTVCPRNIEFCPKLKKQKSPPLDFIPCMHLTYCLSKKSWQIYLITVLFVQKIISFVQNEKKIPPTGYVRGWQSVCPRSLDPLYIVGYFMKWIKTRILSERYR